MHSPLNVESAIAISLLGMAAVRSSCCAPTRTMERRMGWRPLAIMLLATAVCFCPSLSFPLLSDDYWLATNPLGANTIRPDLSHASGDSFYRPAADLAIAAEALWAGTDPLIWHATGLLLHLSNCVLIWMLARRLHIADPAALVAAGIFAVHGSRVEAVSWMGAHYDRQATFFFFWASVLFLQYCDGRRAASITGCLLALALALFSKESAYCFPIAAILFLAISRRPLRSNILPLGAVVVVTSAAFALRWWLQGGMGGYLDPVTGRPEIWNLNAVAIAHTLLWRAWALLLFPINWSEPPSIALLCVFAPGAILAFTRTDRRRLWCAIGLVIALLLPVLSRGLIGRDLLGSRILYLPVAGFSILLAVLLEGIVVETQRAIIAAGLLLFFAGTLEHNLRIWGRVSRLALRTCQEGARGKPITNLPAEIDGVYFFRNGYHECVAAQKLTDKPPSARSCW
jgi:hypothetical protein